MADDDGYDRSAMPEDFSIDAESDEVARHDTKMLEGGERCPGCTPKNLEKKRRTIFVSCALVLAGLTLLIVGAVLVTQTLQTSAGIALCVIGGLCFLPGAYTGFILIQVFRGKSVIDLVPD